MSKTRTQTNHNCLNNVLAETAGLQLLGEVITWTTPNGGTTYVSMREALRAAGLDPDVAKVILPKNAFTRAARRLQDEGVFDAVPTTDPSAQLAFQLTGKSLVTSPTAAVGTTQEWNYAKRETVYLDPNAGTISAADKQLEAQVQAEINRAISHRTGNDVTQVLGRLFDGQLGSLVHLDAGVYFVPTGHAPFLGQVDQFLRQVGGRLNRFPVPKGVAAGEKSIQEGVEAHFQKLIDNHETAIQEFGVDTRAGTLEGAAEKISHTRVLIESYAQYLQDRKDDLLAAVDAARAKLEERVAELTKEKVKKEATGELTGDATNKMLRCLSETPKTVAQIQEEAGMVGCDPGAFYRRVRALVEKGVVVKSGKTFALVPAAVEGTQP
jgi:hypothetical protein